MPEYGMYPIWIQYSSSEPFANINIDELNLSVSLAEKLKEWDAMFQNTFNQEYPPNSGFITNVVESIFEEKGISIWQEMLSELSENYEILYYSTIENKII